VNYPEMWRGERGGAEALSFAHKAFTASAIIAAMTTALLPLWKASEIFLFAFAGTLLAVHVPKRFLFGAQTFLFSFLSFESAEQRRWALRALSLFD
jgi:hypothetical protein